MGDVREQRLRNREEFVLCHAANAASNCPDSTFHTAVSRNQVLIFFYFFFVKPRWDPYAQVTRDGTRVGGCPPPCLSREIAPANRAERAPKALPQQAGGPGGASGLGGLGRAVARLRRSR